MYNEILKKLEDSLEISNSLAEKVEKNLGYKVTNKKVVELVHGNERFATVFVDNDDVWTFTDPEATTGFKIKGIEEMAFALSLIMPELDAFLVDLTEKDNFIVPK